MERYNFLAVEKKWREIKSSMSVKNSKAKKKILLLRDVSLSFWKDTHGTCKKLYNWRRFSTI